MLEFLKLLNTRQWLYVGTFIAGSFVSWWITHGIMARETEKLESEIRAIQIAADQAKKQHDKDKEEIRLTTERLREESSQKLIEVRTQHEEAKTLWQKTLAGKNKQVSDLQILMNVHKAELEDLNRQLGLAKTDKEKAEILSKIKDREQDEKSANLLMQGLQCMDIPLPEEFRRQINSWLK